VRDDPIIEEVRRVREEHAKKFDYDLQRIVADLKKSEDTRAAEGRLVLEPPEACLSMPQPSPRTVRMRRTD
jgi:hypothetical protein